MEQIIGADNVERPDEIKLIIDDMQQMTESEDKYEDK